ncbi:restriction endonuclease subunit S [Parahaliea aestuarii]|uniref:Restriction endonuclease subunit S n=1 Tax=Parahaliea aestuarii TaxID=1852021 RepID=A0A5C8ZUM3_9GAMM|nr:restriction endonuclease subunit S [Parahaliea aestuarii]TXS92213.1 restriction endonuclease subunit S [Parahaliea aestuarii]
MAAVEKLITDSLDVWSSAVKSKAATGRGASGERELYGIKKLRELILDLAVSGLLVPQDKKDSPVKKLLEIMAAEKTKLVREKIIKKPKKYEPIDRDKIPHAIPSTWEWVRLADIGHDWGQKTPDCEFTYIDVGAINKELGVVSEPSVILPSNAPSRARKIVRKGTVIYSTVRPYLLNIAVVDREFEPEPIASTAFAIIHPFTGINASYLHRYLRSPTFVGYVESVQAGIAYPAINDKQFFAGVIPIPPLEEQERIVAKVDELMALCDALEVQQKNSFTAHQTLVETLLAVLTNAQNAEAFNQAWSRIAEHFDTLFTTEHSIGQVEQTILQLAVTGKLVPQYPGDEPASVVLEQIAAEKKQLIEEGKTRKERVPSEEEQNSLGFDLAPGWSLTSVQELCRPEEIVTYGILKPVWSEEGVPTVRISEMRNGEIEIDKLRKCDIERASKFEKTRLVPGDLLITKDGTIGKTAFVPPELEGGNITQHVLRFPVSRFVDRRYIRVCIDAPVCQAWMAGETKGVALKGINVGDFRKMPLPLPPIKEQARIVGKVDELLSICNRLKDCLKSVEKIAVQISDLIGDHLIGSSNNKILTNSGGYKEMKITTQLMLGKRTPGDDSIIAPLIMAENGKADAKAIWKKSQLELPTFYSQLKLEIEAGYVLKPVAGILEG